MKQTIENSKISLMAIEERRKLGYLDNVPIADNIFDVLEKLKINLIEYPIFSNDKVSFSAVITYLNYDGSELVFIGLNSADYYDKQIFSIAHELYHFYARNSTHLNKNIESQATQIENEANLFAAEFLLPQESLKNIIISDFNELDLKNINKRTILRFIIRLQCKWGLPYKSLVKRLDEIGAISSKQYSGLYNIDERNFESDYFKVGLVTDESTFKKLNTITKNIRTSSKNIETIIRNFEDKIIDEDTFRLTLALFNLKPEDFGFEINVSQNDIDELKAFYEID